MDGMAIILRALHINHSSVNRPIEACLTRPRTLIGYSAVTIQPYHSRVDKCKTIVLGINYKHMYTCIYGHSNLLSTFFTATVPIINFNALFLNACCHFSKWSLSATRNTYVCMYVCIYIVCGTKIWR